MGNTFYLKTGDTAPILEAVLEDASGEPIDLTGVSCSFHMFEPRNGASVINTDATIADATNGIVRYPWADDDTDNAGRYRGEFVVTYADGSTETFPNAGYHDIIISE
jgi:hypothetical protein